jgi:NAD(P)-dependent dehydrogenase (short-subunit alcohol dehydrogenase family)
MELTYLGTMLNNRKEAATDQTGRLRTPFGPATTALEVVAGLDLTGRSAVVTGGASGIGVETARALAQAGARVTIAVRNLTAGHRVADDIIATTGNPLVRVAPLNLIDRASVDAFVESWKGPLHILVNNAGIMATPLTRTPQGRELQFATNHLGHFALTLGLHAALAAAADARVVVVSSAGHLRSPVVFDDIDFQTRPYDPFLAYGQSKTANVLFAVEAAHRWAEEGILVNALMPGAVRTEGVANLKITQEQIAKQTAGRDWFWKTPAQGAATSVLLASSPLIQGISGRYFEDCQEAVLQVPGGTSGVAPYALDPIGAARLWQISIEALSAFSVR